MARALQILNCAAGWLLLVVALPVWSQPPGPGALTPGRVLQAEQRFEPAVQRQLARRALAALPIANGALFYIVPATLDNGAQQDQIRYLEYLLDKRALQEALDAAASHDQ